MRVLTVRNPWGTAIIHGVVTSEGSHEVKPVENRTRNIAGAYRGLLAIHIAQGWAVGWPTIWPRRTNGPVLDEALDAQRGHVIGVVDLVDVHHADDCARSVPTNDHDDCDDVYMCSRWAMPDHHHLVLANPRTLPRPIPATGRLGLWRPDDDLLAAITEQLAEVA